MREGTKRENTKHVCRKTYCVTRKAGMHLRVTHYALRAMHCAAFAFFALRAFAHLRAFVIQAFVFQAFAFFVLRAFAYLRGFVIQTSVASCSRPSVL